MWATSPALGLCAAQRRDAALEGEALLVFVSCGAAEEVAAFGVGEEGGDSDRECVGLRRVGEEGDVAVGPGLARRDAAVGDDRLAECHAGHRRAAAGADAVVVRLEEDVAGNEVCAHLLRRELAGDGDARVEIGAMRDDRVAELCTVPADQQHDTIGAVVEDALDRRREERDVEAAEGAEVSDDGAPARLEELLADGADADGIHRVGDVLPRRPIEAHRHRDLVHEEVEPAPAQGEEQLREGHVHHPPAVAGGDVLHEQPRFARESAEGSTENAEGVGLEVRGEHVHRDARQRRGRTGRRRAPHLDDVARFGECADELEGVIAHATRVRGILARHDAPASRRRGARCERRLEDGGRGHARWVCESALRCQARQ
jgi:hypothetical protein